MKMALAKETSKLLSPSWGQALQRFTSTTSKVSATKASIFFGNLKVHFELGYTMVLLLYLFFD